MKSFLPFAANAFIVYFKLSRKTVTLILGFLSLVIYQFADAQSSLQTLPFPSNNNQAGAPAAPGGFYGPMAATTVANQYSRYAYVYSQALLNSGNVSATIASGSVITNLEFDRGVSTGATMGGTTNFKIYLINLSAATTAWGGTTLDWATETGISTLVYNASPASLINAATAKPGNVSFPISSFTYTGGSLGVLVEYTQSTAQSAEISWGYENATTITQYVANSALGIIGTAASIPATSTLGNTNAQSGPVAVRHPTLKVDFNTVPGAPTIGMATAGNTHATVTFTPPASTGGTTITSYTVTSTPGGVTATGTASPVTVTGLTNGIAYTFKVTATNNVGTGAASAVSNSVTPLAPCITPLVPASLNSGTTTISTIPGTIGAPATAPTGYIVISSTNSTLSSGPANGTTYTAGNIVGGGTVQYVNTANTFIASTSLNSNTQYFLFVYSYNSGCTGTPFYSTTSSTANATTLPAAPTIGTATAGNAQATVPFTPPSGTATITGYTVTSTPGGITATGTGSPITITGLTNGTAYTFKVTATNSGGTGAASAASNSVTPIGPCTTPAVPTNGNLTPTSSSVTGTFTASAGGATGYLVIRTSTSTAPSTPVNGTIYTAGTSALGGYIVSYSTTSGGTDNGLSPSTRYWYWTYAYNSTTCTSGPLYSITSLNGNVMTLTCTANTLYWAGQGSTLAHNTSTAFNTAANWSTNQTTYAAAAAAPTACTNVVMPITISSTAALTDNAVLNQSTTIASLTMTGAFTARATGANRNLYFFLDVSTFNLNVVGNVNLSSSGTGAADCGVLLTTSGGNIVIGGTTTIGGTADTKSAYIGNGDAATIGNIYFGDDLTFNANGGTNSADFFNVFFNKSTSQNLINKNATDGSVTFLSLTVGTPTLTLGGTSGDFDYVDLGNLTINSGNALVIPSGYALNQLTSGNGTLSLGSGSKLTAGGGTNTATNTLAGSNFPGGFATYTLDATSTVTYSGTTQTIYNVPAYGNLTLSTTGVKTAGGALTINGNLLNNGTFAASTFSHVVKGNWTNNSSFTTGTGSLVTFNGTALQTIAGTIGTTFNNFTINNTANILLGVATTVSGTFTFTNGKIDASSFPITLSSATPVANISGASSSNYFITGSASAAGYLQLNNLLNTTLYTFPIGTSNYYMPVKLIPATSGLNWTANTYTPVTTNGTYGGPPYTGSGLSGIVNAAWNIAPTTGLTSNTATITINWDAALEGSFFSTYNNSYIGISHFTGGAWQNATATLADNTANTVTSQFNSWSPFGVGAINDPLPVILVDFNAAENNNKTVGLTWITSQEINSSYFEIERSDDQINWTNIGSVPAKGNSTTPSNYNYTDASPLIGTGYYRLKLIDINGDFSYSNIRAVKIVLLNGIHIFPNPANDHIDISISKATSDLNIKLINQIGQIMQVKEVKSGTSGIISLPLNNYTQGAYFIQISGKDGTQQTSKIIIMR